MTANLRTAIALKRAIDTVHQHSTCIGFNVTAGARAEDESGNVYWHIATDDKLRAGYADARDKKDGKGEAEYNYEDGLVPLVNERDGKLIPSKVSHYFEISEALRDCAKMRDMRFIKADLGNVASHFTLTGTGAALPVEGPDVQALYDTLPDGVHGDLATLTTVQDNNVRNARDLTSDKFAVAPAVMEAINAKWRESGICPRDVDIVPYKINIYPKGGKFETHVDTPPAANFVGTVVVCLSDGADIVIEDEEVRFERGEMVAFFGDTPHRVPEVTTDAMRVTATFSVMSRGANTEASMDARILSLTKTRLAQVLDKYRGFGVLLDHDYSFDTDTDALKNGDAYVVAAFKDYAREHPDALVKYGAVVERFHFVNNERDRPMEAEVFPITEEYLTAMASEKDDDWYVIRDPDFDRIVPVVAPDAPPEAKRRRRAGWRDGEDPRMKKGMVRFFQNAPIDEHQWRFERIPKADYTGNDSRPEEINSVYITKAVMLL